MARLAGNLAPAEVVDALLRDQQSFLTLYGDTLLLLVGVVDSEMSVGLTATAVRGSAGTRVKPVLGSMEFHTVIEPLENLRGRARMVRDESAAVARTLELGPHFAVPLRKRADADALYSERISIGRAPNRDIVLRHQSVSKFHAWFEVDEQGLFHVADAGSKNSTWVNGSAIVPRERTHVEAGDLIRFGSVDSVLCSPKTLWTTLRSAR